MAQPRVFTWGKGRGRVEAGGTQIAAMAHSCQLCFFEKRARARRMARRARMRALTARAQSGASWGTSLARHACKSLSEGIGACRHPQPSQPPPTHMTARPAQTCAPRKASPTCRDVPATGKPARWARQGQGRAPYRSGAPCAPCARRPRGAAMRRRGSSRDTSVLAATSLVSTSRR